MKASESKSYDSNQQYEIPDDNYLEFIRPSDIEILEIVQEAFPTPTVPATLTASILAKIKIKSSS